MKILLLLLLPLGLFAQKKKTETIGSLDLIYTSKSLTYNDLSATLSSIDNINMLAPINYIGIGTTSGFIVNRTSSYPGGASFSGFYEWSILLPRKIYFPQENSATVHGFNVAFTVMGKDFIRSKKYDLITCFGFNTGRVALLGSPEFKQKNPYFAPCVSIIPRIVTKHISFQLRASYDYDISFKHWKRKWTAPETVQTLNKFRYEGLNLSVGVGYVMKGR